ncbi:MAG: DUF3883 domain-containing protein [Bacteroidetes bacterium]|nr:DUF3883 domain-containing protein [Bacteroidota bacterium]
MNYGNIITAKTKGTVRTFLASLVNDNKSYRSLHNLTEQIEHQYAGRFLIELLQNGHDALQETGNGIINRIEFLLDENECDYGVLYVANDGNPFTDSNFNALSDLGLSDKDPEKSIGNKGIGFRSVLEICKSPEIYSKSTLSSNSYDGYCFTFNAGLLEQFVDPILSLISSNKEVLYPIGRDEPLTLWGDAERKIFQGRYSGWDRSKLIDELSYLSPYSMPFSIEERPENVMNFESQGFSTVVRLPLVSSEVSELVKNKFKQIDLNTFLFLSKIGEFRLRINDQLKTFSRSAKNLPRNGMHGSKVSLKEYDSQGIEDEASSANYYFWEKHFGGDTKPQEHKLLSQSVKKLPGKWPKLKEVTISVATPISDNPAPGVLNIFLPTLIATGCNSHFSAPFYGDMSRTDVNFSESKPYNQLLLAILAETTIEIVTRYLFNGTNQDCSAIIDLIAPSLGEAGDRWWSQLQTTAEKLGTTLHKIANIHTDDGWVPLDQIRMYPYKFGLEFFTDKQFRSFSKSPVPSKGLSPRIDQIIELADRLDLRVNPTEEELATTLETFAHSIHSANSKPDWNRFWQDVDILFSHRTEPLINSKVVLGLDGTLHAVSDTCSIFFTPLAMVSVDESDITVDVKNIPKSLSPHIAFLDESITTTSIEADGRKRKTNLYKFLERDFIEQFSVEPILRKIVQLVPEELPLSLSDPRSKMCRDILLWGLGLLSRSRSLETSIPHLKRLPAPCRGGWFPLSTTWYGKGWTRSFGSSAEEYLESTETPSANQAIKRFLLPPDHALWGNNGEKYRELLNRAGVMNGLPLVEINDESWNNLFTISGWQSSIHIPSNPPDGCSEELWEEYSQEVASNYKPKFEGSFQYKFGGIYAIPGLEQYRLFESQKRMSLSNLILNSVSVWEYGYPGWRRVILSKQGGQWDQISIHSPASFFLTKQAWLYDNSTEVISFFRPDEKWYIPLSVIGINKPQFSHLHPYPDQIAKILDNDESLITLMKHFSMPKYESQQDAKTSNSRLLNDLAEVLLHHPEEISNKSTFIGQVRLAWSQFYPESTNHYPSYLIAQNKSMGLVAVDPMEAAEVYLPDAKKQVHDGLRLHDKLVLTGILTSVAQRHRELILEAYQGRITPANDLKVKPLVDEKTWKATGNEESFIEVYPEIPVILLSIFAFYGENNAGMGKTFIEAMNLLREAKIYFVENLAAGLWKQDSPIAETKISSMWVGQKQQNTILAQIGAKNDFGMLSNALSSLMRRNDLEIPIQQFFSNVDSDLPDYTVDTRARLNDLHITEDNVREVQEQWLGDLGWMRQLCVLLIRHLDPKVNIDNFSELENHDDLENMLLSNQIQDMPAEQIVPFVRKCGNMRNLGFQLFDKFGSRVELGEWNKTLATVGHPGYENENAKSEFNALIGVLQPVFFALVAEALANSKIAQTFIESADKINSLPFPKDFTRLYWTINFDHIKPMINQLLKDIDLNEPVFSILERSTSLKDATEQIYDTIHADFHDPFSVMASNVRRRREFMEQLIQTSIVWSLKQKVEFSFWEKDSKDIIELAFESDTDDLYLGAMEYSDFLQQLEKAFLERIHPDISKVLSECTSIPEIKQSLKLKDQDFKSAVSRLQAHAQEEVIKKNTIQIAGIQFHNIESNYPKLIDLLVEQIDMDDLPDIDLENVTNLPPIPPKKIRSQSTRGDFKSGRGPGREQVSPALLSLIGIVGEVHAFHMLQKKYGSRYVTASSWKSRNREHFFPGKLGDDGLGCDFIILKEGITHYIEVKATQGSDTVIQLGSSEIELAMEKSRKRKESFKILHITEALSHSPNAILLPNPYEIKHKTKYRFEESGLRVRYSN